MKGKRPVVYNCFFEKTGQAIRANVTSICMPFEKEGCGLLWEVFRSSLLAEREGEKESIGLGKQR